MRFLKAKYFYGLILIALCVLSLQNSRSHHKNARRLDRLNKQIAKIHEIFNYKSLPLEKMEALNVIPEENLILGKQEIRKHKAIFAGIARDNGAHLPVMMRHIEALGELFEDYRVVIFENDSHDATKLLLHLWKLVNPKVEILSENFHFKKRPSIKFMAEARNRYLKALQSNEYAPFDLVIPVDMDMAYGIDVRGILDSFSKIDRWDVVCSNGIFTQQGHMWDAFAFRNDEFPDSPEEFSKKHGKNYWEEVHAIQRIYVPQSDLVPVHSAFGGLAIYKRKVFENCFYDSLEEDCEHVALHKEMQEKHQAKIFMNPSQLIRYEHYR